MVDINWLVKLGNVNIKLRTNKNTLLQSLDNQTLSIINEISQCRKIYSPSNMHPKESVQLVRGTRNLHYSGLF